MAAIVELKPEFDRILMAFVVSEAQSWSVSHKLESIELAA